MDIFEFVNEEWARGSKTDDGSSKIGIFPLAFVALTYDEVAPLTTTTMTLMTITTTTTATTTTKKNDVLVDQSMEATPTSSSSSRTVIVLHDFTAEADEDLEMRVDDRIEVLETVDADWGYGRNTTSGKTGIFPWNFVEDCDGS